MDSGNPDCHHNVPRNPKSAAKEDPQAGCEKKIGGTSAHRMVLLINKHKEGSKIYKFLGKMQIKEDC